MKRQTLLKSTLCLLMALVCNVTWAQTSYFKMGTSTTSLSDGNYVLVAMSDKGTGPVLYEPNAGGGKHYRYEAGKTFAVGDVVSSKYVWTIDETTVDGVQHITVTNYDDDTKAFPVDGAKNLNFTGSGTASLKTEMYTTEGVDYIVLTLDDEAIGYVHANAPGGNPCLSYWPTNGGGASCVKFTFYPVTPTAKAPLFVEPVAGGFYKLKGDNSAKPWLTNQLTNNSIVVSADEADAAIFEKTTNGLKDVATGKYLGMNGSVVSLVANETNVTIGEYYNDTEDGRKYSVKASNNFMYNNNTDGKTHESSAWYTNIERYWGFIEPASIGFTVNMTTGAFGGSGNYRTSWALSNGLLTLSCPAANMNSHDGLIQLHSGQSGTCTYTLTVPRGYTILEYSFDYAFGNSGTGEKNFEVGGVDYPVTAESKTLTVENVNATTTTFKLEGANQPVKMSNFVVKVKVPTAEEIAAAKSEAKAGVVAKAGNLKNAPGYYSYTVNGEKLYTADEVKTAIDAVRTIAEVDAIVASYALNVPEVGKYYRIKGKTSGNYIDASGQNKAQMNMKAEPDYLGSIFLLDEGSKWLNMSTGTYVYNTHSIGEIKANANTWTFILASTGYFKVKSNYSSPWLHDSGNKANRCQNDGSDHEFIIEEVKTVGLTINASGKLNVSATWNGETKTLPATWNTFEGVTITESTLRGAGNATYAFTGFSEGDQSLGSEVPIASLNADRTLTANFAPSFFGTTLAEAAPVHIYNDDDNSYFIRLNATDGFAGKALNSGTCTYTESEMWYFVGTPENFKMYSHKAGADYAVKVAGTGQESAATMAPVAEATSLKLTLKSDGSYRIAPKDGDGDMSFNMYGGKGKDIKLFNGSGSEWLFRCISKDALKVSVAVTGEQPYENNTRVAHLGFTVNGATSSSVLKGNVAALTYYLPVGATFTLSNGYTYRGYIFDSFLDAEGNTAEYTNATIPEGGLNITASYSVDEENKYQYLFYYRDDERNLPYRIPAIATASNNTVLAFSDYRPCSNDIGYGEVDIMLRRSYDNGETWSAPVCIADGQGGNNNVFNVGFGDAAVVADRESGKVLVMAVAGKQVFGSGSATGHNSMAKIVSNDNGENWNAPEDVTSQFMVAENSLFPEAYTMFFGSGRILQSRVYKAENADYYRIYGALLIKHPSSTYTGNCNYVVYSDDFGATWNILGGSIDAGMCCNGGDEPKVEELPDGSIVLSSRKYNGRYFNVFTYTDKATGAGAWGEAVASNNQTDGISFGGNATNGEIYKVKAIHNESGRICDVMLQSIPTGGGRSNVSVYFKEMSYAEAYTPTTFAQNWTKGLEVSPFGSAYSTMILQADGNFGFFYEEEPGDQWAYCMVYVPLSLEEMTNGAYSLYTVNSTIGQYGIGTFYASEAMQIPEGIKAYVATEELVMEGEGENRTGVLTLTELEDIIPANTGALIYGDAEKTYNFVPSISYGTAVDVKGNMLVGFEGADNKAETMQAVALPTDGSTNYVLTVKNDVAGFYRKEAGFNVANNKAYLNLPATETPAQALRIRFAGDIETGIESVANSQQPTVIYDLQGRRVMNPTKGMYIIDGKKVIF